MGPGECGKDSGVGDVVGGVGEARIEAAQKGEDELRVLDRMADAAKSGGLDLSRWQYADMVLSPCTME